MDFSLPKDIRDWLNFMLDTIHELRAENTKLKTDYENLRANYEILADQLVKKDETT